MTARTIVVGDVHGCLEELDELLARVEPRRGEDRLIFVGDLVDRGPDPVGVVRRARELAAEAVLGNHEEKHLRWAAHEARKLEKPDYRNPMRAFPEKARLEHAGLSPDDLAWLRALPLTLRLDERWLVVHAGLLPGKPVAEQRPSTLLRLRHVDTGGNFVTLGDEGAGTAPWATRWTGPESVIYGHDVHGLERPRRDVPAPGVECWGIDTGCCYGGRLTALVLPALEVVQVPAKRAYARRREAREDV